ncbi:Probable ribosome biogenesis protein TSR3, related, partial [Eimeria necatrix]
VRVGLAVVDCSWNRVLEGRRAQHIDFVRKNVRVLPLLLCGNPTYYGAPNILTCAEALPGAHYIAGYRRHANLLLQSFTWGPHFLELNSSFLERYTRVSSAAEMKALKLQQEAEMLAKKVQKEEDKAANQKGYSAVYTDLDPEEANT